MAVTAALIKELRQRTSAPMMDCKNALSQTAGDMEAAIDLMRASGAAKAAKKASRVAAEGLVNISISADAKTAAMLEVNSETDFVSKSPQFIDFVNTLGALALKTQPENLQQLLAQTLANGENINKAKENIIIKVGENINIRRVKTMQTNGIIGAYKHAQRIAVLVEIEGGNEATAKDIAMHIAAAKPECVAENDLSAEIIQREKAIFIEQAKESGKTDEIIEKMVGGRMKKFINEVVLIKQPFIKNADISVGKLLSDQGAKVINFARFEVGEGIEKKADDFAKEVMAQVRA